MKQLYVLWLCCLFTTLAAQENNTIALEYSDTDGNRFVSTMEFSKEHAGRNVYTDGTLFVHWSGLQWTIGDRNEPFFVTEIATDPNPPDLASGNWRAVNSSTELIVFSGTGTIDNGPPIGITLSVTAGIDCRGGNQGRLTATVDQGVGSFDYEWSTGSSTKNSADFDNTLTGLTAGTYSVTVTDGNGSTVSESVTLTEPEALLAHAEVVQDVSCHGGLNGSVSAAATGGTKPYRYAWSFGATTASVSALEAGDYFLTVTDANGCTTATSLTIEEPDALVPSLTVSDANCGEAGTANLSVEGGEQPYTFRWSTGGTGAAITDLSGGDYSVTVTDANGCSWDTTFSVQETSALDLTLSSTTDSGAGDGTAGVAVAGGQLPYTYVWSNDPQDTTAVVSGLTSGIYTVEVTDAGGCRRRAMVKIPLAIPGAVCTTAIGVDSLLGGVPGAPLVLSPVDNGNYRQGIPLPEELAGCFNGEDSLRHPVWFTFTGDGSTYNLSLAGCDGGDCLGETDLQAAIFTGACGNLGATFCNQVTTEAGVQYLVVVDGKAGATGRFQLEMTAMASTSVSRPVVGAASVYPNPTDGRVNLEGLKARRVAVFSNLGRLLLHVDGPVTEVDLSALTAGVYTLRITDHRNDTYTARVIRN